jgi:elongation factor P--(R)-beta-lysine ligase
MADGWPLVKKREILWIRAGMIQAVRQYFIDRGYLEIETPNRIPAPAPEYHIDAVPSGNWFLHTSPELCMKRLLASGYPAIFQICKCFRSGERGGLHLPEFTLLEWYRTGIDYRQLMEECEDLLRHVAGKLGLGHMITYGRDHIRLDGSWERVSVKEAFARYAPCSLEEALSGNRFDDVLATFVEPHLGRSCPTFLYNYPLSLGALARVHPPDPTVAERFELYLAGMELANAFSELTDEEEQRQRFVQEERLRRQAGKVPYPSPEPFLCALSHLSDSAGIALGLDRLAMLMTGASAIDDVVTFTPEQL